MPFPIPLPIPLPSDQVANPVTNAARYLSTNILASLKRRSFIPSNNETFSDTDLYEILNEEMVSYILPFIRECNEELLIRNYDLATPANGRVRLPQRFGVESVKCLYGSTDNVNFLPIPRIEPEQRYTQSTAWFFDDDAIQLAYVPSNVTQLRLTYYFRPNALVPTEFCGIIDGVNLTTGVLTATTTLIPAALATSLGDVIDAQPGLRVLSFDLVPQSSTGTTITYLPAALSPDIVIGDYLCVAGESCVPNIPADMIPLWIQKAVTVVLGAKNDTALTQQLQRLQQMEAAARSGFTVRSQGSPRYIRSPLPVANNWPGLGASFWRWRP